MDTNLNVNDINLSVSNYKDLQQLLVNYAEIKADYKEKKRALHKMNAERSNHSSNNSSFLSFFTTHKNQSNKKSDEDYINQFNLEKDVNNLKMQKDNIFYELRKIIAQMIADNEEYKSFYSQYLDYLSYNSELKEHHKYHLELVKYKKAIDKFFNKLKNDMEENKQLSEDEITEYQKQYRKIIAFLKRLHAADKGGKKINQDHDEETFEFNSELYLDDAYTVLSIISLIYSNLINPIYNNYKDAYIQYEIRDRYIKKYNKRIVDLTYKALKYADGLNNDLD